MAGIANQTCAKAPFQGSATRGEAVWGFVWVGGEGGSMNNSCVEPFWKVWRRSLFRVPVVVK